MSDGWKCPNCGKAHPIWVDTCPEPRRKTGCDHWYNWLGVCLLCGHSKHQRGGEWRSSAQTVKGDA